MQAGIGLDAGSMPLQLESASMFAAGAGLTDRTTLPQKCAGSHVFSHKVTH